MQRMGYSWQYLKDKRYIEAEDIARTSKIGLCRGVLISAGNCGLKRWQSLHVFKNIHYSTPKNLIVSKKDCLVTAR
jgi:hypothetical protein